MTYRYLATFLPLRKKHGASAVSLIVHLGGLLGVVLAVFVGFSVIKNPPVSSSGSTTDLVKMQESTLAQLNYELVLTEDNPKVLRYEAREIQQDGSYQNITVHRWMSLLLEDKTDTQIAQFNNILRNNNDMKAFFFETKGINYKTAHETHFEFVLVESDKLYQFADAKQDDSDFGQLLECDSVVGCVFPNLGGDSTLIAPTRQVLAQNSTTHNVYGHLAAFLRRAPLEQQVLPFWRLCIETLLQQLKEERGETYWFSTDGTGVKWLHVRIDPRPKYYDYLPFAQ